MTCLGAAFGVGLVVEFAAGLVVEFAAGFAAEFDVVVVVPCAIACKPANKKMIVTNAIRFIDDDLPALAVICRPIHTVLA
jgi:hypothetical protein